VRPQDAAPANRGVQCSLNRVDHQPGIECATPNHGVDVSHRGGLAGFLKFAADGAIIVPDYRGNRFFNTLGNLAINPRAGLLFINFARGDLLQLAGETDIVWDGPEVAAAAGAERIWRLAPSHGRWLRAALPLRFALG
jgi:uncharacterized protein